MNSTFHENEKSALGKETFNTNYQGTDHSNEIVESKRFPKRPLRVAVLTNKNQNHINVKINVKPDSIQAREIILYDY
jgi:hypothetical protein